MTESFEKQARRRCREIKKQPRNENLLKDAYAYLSGAADDDIASMFEAMRADADSVNGLLLVRRAFLDEIQAVVEFCLARVDDGLLLELQDWHDESSAECSTRLDSLGSTGHYVALDMQQLVIDGKESIEIRLIQNTPTGQVKQCLWDVRTIETSFAAELAYLMCNFNDNIVFRKGPARSFSAGPLYHLHPERFKQSRSYYKTALNRLGQMHRDRTLSSDMTRTSEPIIHAMQKEGINHPLRAKLANPQPPAVHASNEWEITWFLYKFVGAGRQIFALSNELVEMFRNTSVDEIPVSDLFSPYSCYYVHFGAQKDLGVGEGWQLDGVYIEHLSDLDLIQFGFTAAPDDGRAALEWHSVKEPWRVLALKGQGSESLGDAVRAVIAEKRQSIVEKIAKGNQDITRELRELADQTGDDIPFKQVIDYAERNGRLELTDLDRNLPAFQGALEIAVNAMCYLTAYRDDTRQRWPEGAPEKLTIKAQTGTPNQRRRAVSKLEALGYTKVHYCGDFAATVQSFADDSRSVRTHWRRGHWRSQPYGPGRQLRKMVLIRPILVNAGSDTSDEPLGHIYIGQHIPTDHDTIH